MIHIIRGCPKEKELLPKFLSTCADSIFLDSREKGYYLRYIKLLAESTNLIRVKVGNNYSESMANDNIILFMSGTVLNNPLNIIAAKHSATLLNLDVKLINLDKLNQQKEQK